MPLNHNFWNPYRFVPVRDEIRREAPLTGETFKSKAHSGAIRCRLTNVSPLYIGVNANASSRPMYASKQELIPGSSLKGMLRSLAELVGGGCPVTYNNRVTYKLPRNLYPCYDTKQLCIACRMYGMMVESRLLKGKVFIGDAHLTAGDGRTRDMDVYLGSPKAAHEAFYRSPASGIFDGMARKLYFHQPLQKDKLTVPSGRAVERKWRIQALPHGHVFRFEIQFQNLTDAELSLLLYTVALEEQVTVSTRLNDKERLTLTGPLLHKLGNAKALGGGSCRIEVENLSFLAPPAIRFASLTSSGTKSFEGAELNAELQRLTACHRDDTAPTMEQLRIMMVWDENDPRDFRFPDYLWFKAPGNSRIALKGIRGDG